MAESRQEPDPSNFSLTPSVLEPGSKQVINGKPNTDFTSALHDPVLNMKQFFIDELGFYRLLKLKRSDLKNLDQAILKTIKLVGNQDCGGYESNLCDVKMDKRLSLFDKRDDYEQWKQSWDDFMLAKLITEAPLNLNEELKIRLRSGVPHDYRHKVWTALIQMHTRKIRSLATNQNIYQDLLSLDCGQKQPRTSSLNYVSSTGEQISTSGLSSERPFIDKCFRQIDLDLLRTLPNNRHFESLNSQGVHRVRRVLRAYARFNPTIGYCQGMNRLAAMSLLILPEEEAFWCLVAIIQCIMPPNYYLEPWLAQVDCWVLGDILEKKMPLLYSHITKNEIELTLFTWFFTIFVDGFRPELMLRIWDCFLLEGDKVLFRFALAILYVSQGKLLMMNDFTKMSSYLSYLISSKELDVELLFESKYSLKPNGESIRHHSRL